VDAARAALETYRRKRRFGDTPEPAGDEAAEAGRRFVIQKHWATRLHFDFRLELDGVLKSWAVPKGPSIDTTVKRMAVPTEDHPLAYATFAGTIPDGHYGAGRVVVWDRGLWQPLGDPHDGLARGELKFELQGERLQGRWVLVRMKHDRSGRDDKPAWLLIKERDEHARSVPELDPATLYEDGLPPAPPPGAASRKATAKLARRGGSAPAATPATPDSAPSARDSTPKPSRRRSTKPAARGKTALPEALAPMLATPAAQAPSDPDAWAYELKFDGYRVMLHVDAHGDARALTRNGLDWTRLMPDIAAAAARALPASSWIDGELIALDDEGRPSFDALQAALSQGTRHGRLVVRSRPAPTAAALPAVLRYAVFDAPFLAGTDLRAHTWTARRRALEAAFRAFRASDDDLTRLQLSEVFDVPVAELRAAAEALGLEGVIGKRRDSLYASGQRTGDWVKLKSVRRQEFVVVGHTPGQGQGEDPGSLALAEPAELAVAPGARGKAGWRYVGNVGSGFSVAQRRELRGLLSGLKASTEPTAAVVGETPREVQWVEPKLVVEVAYGAWTAQHRLRHAVFHGLRLDKSAGDVRHDGRDAPIEEAAMPSPSPAKTSRKSSAVPKAEASPSGPSARNATKATKATKAAKPRAAPAATAESSQPEAKPSHSPNTPNTPNTPLPKDLRVTHAGRRIDPGSGITKGRVLEHYARVAGLMLDHLRGRPVAILRAPQGIDGQHFFQKHLDAAAAPAGVTVLDPSLDIDHEPLIEIAEPRGLLEAAQLNAIEFHTWNARKDRIEQPDRIVLDLDPGEGVGWAELQDAARLVRTLVETLGLVPFLKTSGGKGLHVVVPIQRRLGWDAVKACAKAMSEHLARVFPDRFVAISGPKRRVGRIFVDYLRNGRGATTVAAWSLRARPGMGVSVPIGWNELDAVKAGDHWTLATIEPRLALGNAPWDGIAKAAASLREAQRRLGA